MASAKSVVEDWAEFILPEDLQEFLDRVAHEPGSTALRWAQIAHDMGYGSAGSGKPFFAMEGFTPHTPYEPICANVNALLERCAELRGSVEGLSDQEYHDQS